MAATGSLVLIVAFLVAAGTSGAGRRAAWLGAVTGLLFGLTAALVKAVGSQLSSGVLPALLSWPLYALLVIGPAGLLINQVAFQAGPLAASLPAITAVDPVASIVLGLLLFDERLQGRPFAATVEGIALAVLAVAVVRLARAERDPHSRAPADWDPAEPAEPLVPPPPRRRHGLLLKLQGRATARRR